MFIGILEFTLFTRILPYFINITLELKNWKYLALLLSDLNIASNELPFPYLNQLF